MSATAVYVVTARRYGDAEKHSYVVGVFSDEKTAFQARAAEVAARANKYDCEILKTEVQSCVDIPGVLDYELDYVYRCPGHDLLNPPDLGEYESFAQECVNQWGLV